MCAVSQQPKIIDCGLVAYREMWARQRKLFDRLVAASHDGQMLDEETVFLVEHPPVYTLGRHAHRENVLWSAEHLAREGMEVVEIERGGDVTFHGPGQLVVYPIIYLNRHHLGVKSYVDLLEQAVIDLLALYGIQGERDEGATGVWIEPSTPRARKISAIGVKCSRFVTMHGLSLNVDVDLSCFHAINPCGFTDRGVTSLAVELSQAGTPCPSMAEIKTKFSEIFLNLLAHKPSPL
ncbi:MAG: lipoyl(octanoyl) transferase LipB [Bacteroidales bacterium]|nr:lipoyl(octanoyl) transferase LipB [Bacteroidales bacterium]